MSSDPAIPEVTVTVSPDGLTATMSIPTDLPAAASTVDALSEAIKKRCVLINDERKLVLEELVCTLKPIREETVEFVVAQGRPPVPGEDGCFELDPELEDQEHVEQPDEPEEEGEDEDVDYYAQSKLRIVLAKQRVGRLIPPTDAVDGEDVAGKTITAKPGKPCPLRPDATIRMESDGTLFAIESGILETVGEILKIEPDLVISGYVDFSTGNVDFPGSLSIAKGVRDRFVVASDQSIEVRELVEAASLRAGLDITLLRGAAGRGKGIVRTGRDLHAKYLDGVKGHIGRDACINNELNECEMYIGRSLDSPRCTIVGGSLMVGKSCEIEQLGGEGGVTTDVILGRHNSMELRGHKLIALKEQIEHELAKLNIRLKKLQRATGDESVDVAAETAAAQQNMMMLDAKHRSIKSSLVSAARRFVENDVWLLVHKDIYQGARVWIGKFCAEFRQDVKGPVKVHLDPKGVPQICEVETNASMVLASVAKVTPDDRYVQWAALLGTTSGDGDQKAA